MSITPNEKRISNIEEREKINLLRVVFQNWYIFLFVGSIIVGWTTLNISSNAHAAAILELSEKVKDDENIASAGNSQIQIQLSQIQTDLAWIKLKLR